jgi:hypothetical protein
MIPSSILPVVASIDSHALGLVFFGLAWALSSDRVIAFFRPSDAAADQARYRKAFSRGIGWLAFGLGLVILVGGLK